jgi:hypothetical protein
MNREKIGQKRSARPALADDFGSGNGRFRAIDGYTINANVMLLT